MEEVEEGEVVDQDSKKAVYNKKGEEAKTRKWKVWACKKYLRGFLLIFIIVVLHFIRFFKGLNSQLLPVDLITAILIMI